MRLLPLRSLSLALALAGAALSGTACGPTVEGPGARSPVAEKWQLRAKASYRSGDFDDAAQACDSGIQVAPKDVEIRVLAARVALAKLDFTKAAKLTEGLDATDAHAVRGRALWYLGDMEQAADELEAMLRDPQVKDPWARDVAKLARRGHGRHPFAMEGGLLAAVDMPQAGPALIVPFEIEGEQVLGMVSTAVGELVVDSASRKEPAWVNLRFGQNVEVKDVPAFT
ncbi:MAG: tetratricopeptide repeat protein, partial [Myxococcales bacterium]|nr:tetratricopeptide repeat protein [Myxococcales bacterium]